jgi:Ca2+/H+ antiporter, TMEM165/GDT1 family
MQSLCFRAVTQLSVCTNFGCVLHNILRLQDDGPSELEEVENEMNSSSPGRRQTSGLRSRLVSNVVIEAFTMTFLAEWGDRSQITTISLAAVQNAVGVTVGGCIGHILCTGAAVLGGKQLASVIDERTVNLVGAIMFILFGALAIYEGPGE